MERITAGPNPNEQFRGEPPEAPAHSQTQQHESVQPVRFRIYQVIPGPRQTRSYRRLLLPSEELSKSEEHEVIRLPHRQAMPLTTMSLQGMQSQAVQLQSTPLTTMSLQGMQLQLQAMQLQAMQLQLQAMQLQAMQLQGMQLQAMQLQAMKLQAKYSDNRNRIFSASELSSSGISKVKADGQVLMPLTATPEAVSVSCPESEPPDAASIDFPRGFTDHLLRKPPWQTVDEFFIECYPYSCGLCKQSFAEGEMLMKHMLNKHETADERLRERYPFFCDLCDAYYAQPNWLQEHIAKNHMNQALDVEERCYLSFSGVASAVQDSNNQPD